MRKTISFEKEGMHEKFKKNNWKENNLKKKVKSVTTIKNKLMIENNESEKAIDYYDEKGNLVKSIGCNNRGIRTDLVISSYDSNDFIISAKYYDCDNVLMAEISFEHLEYGGLISKWNTGHKEITKYNLDENIVQTDCYFNDGQLDYQETYEYFSEKSSQCNYIDDYVKKRTTSFLDDLGNLIAHNTYSYDEYSQNQKIAKKNSYKYVFDENLNWIKKTTYLIEESVEIPEAIYEREIIYY